MSVFLDLLDILEAPLRIAKQGPEQFLRIADLGPTLIRMLDRVDAHGLLEPQKMWVKTFRERCAHISTEARSGHREAIALWGLIQAARVVPVVATKVVASANALAPDALVQYVKGVGPKLATSLNEHGILTVADLLCYFPRRFEGHQGTSVAQLMPEMTASVFVTVARVPQLRGFGGKTSLSVLVRDDSGFVQLKWFRVPGGKTFADKFQMGRKLRATGKTSSFGNQMQMVHPTVVFDGDAEIQAPSDAIVSWYSEIPGVRQQHLRKIIVAASGSIAALHDPLPVTLRKMRGLPALRDCAQALHFPEDLKAVDTLNERKTPWQRRLAYEEFLLLQLAMLRRKQVGTKSSGLALSKLKLTERAARLFPFPLTGAQKRVLDILERDMGSGHAMQRLLQGDVGSGKTAVALSAAAGVVSSGYQAAIMVPTEVLADQHFRGAKKWLEPQGIRVALLTGGMRTAGRRAVLEELASGQLDVVIGTHALIQDGVQFKCLGLAVIDEQHRFGVLQRASLASFDRSGSHVLPHTLVMTATPIPRTLAMTVYGDLDVAILDELPPGRTPIKTYLCREKEREDVYAKVRVAITEGRQAYVVLPLVEDSDKEGVEHLRSATETAEELSGGFLHGLRVGLLHGRMSSYDKDTALRDFAAGEIQVLVSTTVIEVGIDVANATVMVIENAERFGLSQLHQLRGRVGRGAHASTCYLVPGFTRSEDAWQRLSVMTKTSDGFVIAEEDLAIRGPGDFVGIRQAGVPLLSYANLARDGDLLEVARDDARAILQEDPELTHDVHQALRLTLEERWEKRLGLAAVA